MPESLSQQRIADQYTSLLHVSGASIASWDFSSIGKGKEKANVYDGAGNVTGISLSSADDRVIINNYIEPEGWSYKKEWLDAFFPINSVILTTNFQNPMFRISGTRWVLESQGIFPVGVGTGTDKNNDSFTFTAGNKERHILNLSNGDIAGEFRSTMDVEDLPLHRHTTDTQTEIIPEQRDGEGTNVGFVFYFGDVINPRQLVRDDERYLDADAIEAFEYNTTYGNTSHYRDFLIRENHRNGKVYTDADFNPRFANQTLQGWAPPQAGGAGWGGILNTSGKFIGSSPRPVGVRWEFQGTVYYIAKSFYDPRSNDRVHPGRFSDRELIKARDFIIHTLGITEAAKALAGVDRLIELGATVEQAYGGDNTYFGQIPMNKIVESSTTGQYVRHNNIPPNFPIYLWRRVPLDYVENIPPIDRPGTNLPMQFVITSNKKSTKNDVFNLNQWAADKGWNGQARCKIIIDEGVYIYSDDPNDDKVPAMVIDQFPEGLELINNGFIMGRGGNGGSKFSLNRSGQAGGDAIHVTGNSEIVINNSQGAIGGGGGGGAPAYNGENSGGGGGAGGGWGGTSRLFIPGQSYYSGDGDGGLGPGGTPTTASGGIGGQPGSSGGAGHYFVRVVSQHSLQVFKGAGDIVTVGWGPKFEILPGIGGQAGGSGAGGRKWNGRDSQGTGGGGGRIITSTAYGGGTGGVSGATFGALDINGKLKDGREGGPLWSGTRPRNNGSAEEICRKKKRKRSRCTWHYRTAYNSSTPYLGWLSGYPLHSGQGYGNGRGGNIGPHWRAAGVRGGTSGLPYTLARVQWPSSRYGYNGWSYVSPTGWNGYQHRSALIRGGSIDQPGIWTASSKFGAGGGGWGAPGAGTKKSSSGSYHGGVGGYSVRATGGSVTITGGIIYGETEGNVNIG